MKSLSELQKILYKELYRKSFYEFVKAFWHTAEPNKFIDGALIKIYCEMFQYICKPWIGYNEININVPKKTDEIDVIDIRNNKNKLCINVPPRHTKTLIFSVFGPVWLWTYHTIKAVSVSHTQGLSIDINSKRKMIVNSLEYKELYNEIELISDSKSSVKDVRGGELYAINRNALTGYGCDLACLDDLTNAETARKDQEEMGNAWSFYRNTMPSRVNDINKSVILNIQQRLSPNDITGHILNDEKLTSQYNFVILPAVFKKETYIVCPISGDIIHFNKGDFLWPERFGNYESLRFQVGESIWETQYLQNPIATDRTVIKEDMINEKDLPDTPGIESADIIYAGHDFPVKDKETSDYLGSTLLYKFKGNLYVVDCLEKRMGFKKSVDYVSSLEEAYPGIIQVIEDKANGSPIIEQLQDEISGIVSFNPGTQSKMQRLESASLYMGNVYFVKTIFDKMTNTWQLSSSLRNLKERLIAFPFVEHDDIVDSFDMLLLFIFKDKRYQVYSRAFNDRNIIKVDEEIKKLPSTVFFNKEGDNWKVCEIAIKYSENSQLIVLSEHQFKESVEDGLKKLAELYPNKKVFIDCSYTNSLIGMFKKSVVIERYEEDDFDRSVANLNLMLANKRILLNNICTSMKADIELFKYSKSKDENNIKYVTEKDGFVACLRIASKYYSVK